MNEPTDKILSRIQKLLALASNNPSEHEAASAAAMAGSLMRKYQIDQSDLIAKELRENNGGIVKELLDEPRYKVRFPVWYSTLAVKVSLTLDCHVRIFVLNPVDPRPVIGIHGYEKDIQVAKWLFKYILDQVEKLCTKAWKDYGRDSLLDNYKSVNPATTRRWKDNYRFGVVCRVIREIERVYSSETLNEEQSKTGSELVVLKNALIKEKFGEFGYNESSKALNEVAVRGVEDGDKIAVNKIVENEFTRPSVGLLK